MAIQDIGMFLPAESHYKRPGAYTEALQAEATKRAAYLSNMDQFYENLNEAQRQFNETLAFKTETRDLELEFGREKLSQQASMHAAEMESEKAYRDRMLDLKEREIDLQEDRMDGDDDPWVPIYRRTDPGDVLDLLGQQAEANRQAAFGTRGTTGQITYGYNMPQNQRAPTQASNKIDVDKWRGKPIEETPYYRPPSNTGSLIGGGASAGGYGGGYSDDIYY